MRKIVLATIVAISLMLPALVASPVSAHESEDDNIAATYTVTIRNLTGGQYLTPPNWAAHDDDVEIFEKGDEASAGLQQVAENGAVPVLAAELTANIDAQGHGISGVGAADVIAPGGTAEWEFVSTEESFSLATMIICTNDGFGGIDSKRLPRRDGQTKTYRVRAFDAGTEINTEAHVDLVPAPFCGGGGLGTGMTNPALAEGGEIRRHRGIKGVGDLNSSFDWDGPVAEVTITRVDPAPNYSITVENLTSGQYLTPPNVAIHDKTVDVFSKGHPASAGVQAVAENGDVPVLGAELTASVDAAGLGASTVGGSTPIAPGEVRMFDLASKGSRLSLVAMIICTNDGFTGLDSKRLKLDPGESKTFYLRSFDAGTEINTEMNVDIVPAPFCGGGGIGTGMSNPLLAENGVITRHGGITGSGDLDATFDWDDPVVKLTITRD